MNESLLPQFLDPLVQTVRQFLGLLQYVLGGVFGVYLLLVFLRWKEARDIKRLLVSMQNQLFQINQQLRQMNQQEERRKKPSAKKKRKSRKVSSD